MESSTYTVQREMKDHAAVSFKYDYGDAMISIGREIWLSSISFTWLEPRWLAAERGRGFARHPSPSRYILRRVSVRRSFLKIGRNHKDELDLLRQLFNICC